MRGLGDTAEAEPLADVRVGAVHGLEGDHEQRQRDHDQPGALRELGRGHDDRGDTGEDRAEAVQQGFSTPAGAAFTAPVPDHADLRDREADEDADREERHEGVGVAAGEHQQRGRDRGQREHTVPVHLAVGLEGEDVRKVVVAGQQFQQHRQPAEGRVRGQGEQDHRRELDDVESPVVAEGGVRELGEDGDSLDGLEVEAGDQDGQADQHHAEHRAEGDLRALGPLHAGCAEGGHGVGDGLDAGEGAAPAGESFQQQQGADARRVVGERGGVSVGGRGAHRHGPEEADRDQHEDGADEDHRGHDEGAGRLDDPAQVHRRHQHEHRETQPQPVVVESREGRGQSGDTGRDGHRDVQDVVQHQRGRRDQAGPGAEVGLRHGVGAAAVREGRDDLPVRGDEHREQTGDGERDREGEAEPVRTGGGQHEDDRLGAVGHRRHGVQGEGGEPGGRGQPVAFAGIRGLLVGGCRTRLDGENGHAGGSFTYGRAVTGTRECASGSVPPWPVSSSPCGFFAPNRLSLTGT